MMSIQITKVNNLDTHPDFVVMSYELSFIAKTQVQTY